MLMIGGESPQQKLVTRFLDTQESQSRSTTGSVPTGTTTEIQEYSSDEKTYIPVTREAKARAAILAKIDPNSDKW